MKKFRNLYLSRFIPSGLLAFVAALLMAPAVANATPFVVKLMQQGSNVIATGSGAFDLTSLAYRGSGVGTVFETINPSKAFFNLGQPNTSETLDQYSGLITGPTNYGSGSSYWVASVGNGSTVVFDGGGDTLSVSKLYLPPGYRSGDPLSNTTTWDNASFASLGLTPGRYVWIWGTGAEQRFTLVIGGAVTAPEPATLGMYGFGVLLIGAFVGLRRRAA